MKTIKNVEEQADRLNDISSINNDVFYFTNKHKLMKALVVIRRYKFFILKQYKRFDLVVTQNNKR